MELKRHSADEAMFMVIENHEVVVLALRFTDKSALKRRTAVIPSNEDECHAIAPMITSAENIYQISDV